MCVTKVYQWSMKPTLQEGDLLAVEKVSYRIREPKRGEIVILLKDEGKGIESTYIGRFLVDYKNKYEHKPERERYVKRIIGLPGDEVDIKDGSVYINGTKLEEDYTLGVTVDTKGKYPKKIPEGYYFVMGDNRENSVDSRMFGCMSRAQIESRVWFKILSR
ncbi:MAG: signal peptidase I, partial [Cellulosilyticaceae bacterium]